MITQREAVEKLVSDARQKGIVEEALQKDPPDHDEAFLWAVSTMSKSNLARCYLELYKKVMMPK